jgi:hypothetical protein
MKISDLNFVSETPVTKTLKIGDNEYTVEIKQISFGDMEAAKGSSVALISRCVIFDGGQTLTEEQAARLDMQTAAQLTALIAEANAPKP